MVLTLDDVREAARLMAEEREANLEAGRSPTMAPMTADKAVPIPIVRFEDETTDDAPTADDDRDPEEGAHQDEFRIRDEGSDLGHAVGDNGDRDKDDDRADNEDYDHDHDQYEDHDYDHGSHPERDRDRTTEASKAMPPPRLPPDGPSRSRRQVEKQPVREVRQAEGSFVSANQRISERESMEVVNERIDAMRILSMEINDRQAEVAKLKAQRLMLEAAHARWKASQSRGYSGSEPTLGEDDGY